MGTTLREPITTGEFLAWEDRQGLRWEFDGSRPIARARGKVTLAQDRVAATVYAREGGDWIGRTLGEDAVLTMPEIGLDIPLAELYTDLDLSQPSAGDA